MMRVARASFLCEFFEPVCSSSAISINSICDDFDRYSPILPIFDGRKFATGNGQATSAIVAGVHYRDAAGGVRPSGSLVDL